MTTNMTPANRIAEKLKNDTLGEFFTEEDLLKLSKEAIEIAFFTGTPGSYNTAAVPPLIVKLAQDHLDVKVKEWIEEMWPKIVNADTFQSKMGELMVSSLGDSLVRAMERHWTSQFTQNVHKFGPMIADIVKQKL